jgi:hypothetical protein
MREPARSELFVNQALQKLCWRLGLMLCTGCLVLVAIPNLLRDNAPQLYPWAIQLLLATLIATVVQFGVLAAAMAVLAPGPLRWRLLWSFAGGLLTIASLAVGIYLAEGAAEGAASVLVVGIANWALSLALLSGIRMLTGIRWLHAESPVPVGGSRSGQFEIRQLLYLTGVTAGILGLGRITIADSWLGNDSANILLVYGVLFASFWLHSLPATLALFLPTRRQVAVGLVVGVLFALGVTAAEFYLLPKLIVWLGPVPVFALIAMNTISLCWSVLFALIVRSSGFRFRSAAELKAMAARDEVAATA